jgi:hypothetical protein
LAVALPTSGFGQDIGWLLDQAPVVSVVLAQALQKCPSFSAKVEVNVSGNADPSPSAASGQIASDGGNLRWTIELKDVQSAQLSAHARTVVRQINGEQFVLLTRPDQQSNYLVLPGARSYLEQPLPAVRLSRSKAQVLTERMDGHPCSKERWRVTRADGSTNEVLFWRAKDLKNLLLQLQFSDSGELIQVRFRDIKLRPLGPEYFQLPGGLAKYNSMDDLVQSVVLERVKKRMGL